MRDITLKPPSLRSATAQGRVKLSAEGLAMIAEQRVAKGNVQECARIAGLMAVKRTSDWLPHCHPIPILDAELMFTLEDTALVIERGRGIEVVGKGAVTLLDGRRMVSNHAAALSRERLELLGVRLHLLPAGNRYGLVEGSSGRSPIPPSLADALRLLVAIGSLRE